MVGHYGRQNILERIRNHNVRQREFRVILRHADVLKILRNTITRNRSVQSFGILQIASTLCRKSALACQTPRNLPGTVRAEVEVDDGIAIANHAKRFANVVHANEWNNE